MTGKISPPLPPPIHAAIAGYSPPAQQAFLTLRALIFETAAAHPQALPLTETLKWGEPSYAPQKPRIGTAIRLGWKANVPDGISLYVNCQTSLVSEWRDLYEDQLQLIGNREIRLPLGVDLPTLALRHCIEMALTYHLRKTHSPG